MRPILFAPALVLALSACANGGMQGAQTTSAPATASAPVAASVAAPSGGVDPYATGRIVLVEPVAPIGRRGGNAALAIGSTVLGAFIPGPWGSVASVTAGQAGQYALSTAERKTLRYHVRMPDGAIRTVTQADPLALGVGTDVQFLTLADGSARIVQTALPTLPVAVPG